MAEKQKDKDFNVIFVGNKPFMNYVTGIVMQFTTQGATQVSVRARGKFKD
jgi:DNA-binding protein Alba